MSFIPLQAVPENSSGSRRPKKGQVAVDAWQPADVTKRNVRPHDCMAAAPYSQTGHGKVEHGNVWAAAVVHLVVLCRCGIATADLCPRVERST